ncbi:MAG TPA: FecR domain-containing protein [Terriglobia bacterium]
MKDNDYLWDGSGEPDPEVEKLEAVLGRFRHNRPAPEFLEIAPPARRPSAVKTAWWPPRWQLGPRPRWLPVMAAAASLLIAAAAWIALRRPHGTAPRPGASAAGWDVARLAGAPRVGSRPINREISSGKLAVGQLLVTDSSSRASVQVDGIGEMEVEPDTRLRLLETGATQKRLSLERGTIHAAIWAPPGEFVVDTPSAVAVDLGCAYTLQVDDSGAGLIRTTLGWVGFKLGGRESFIPAGAACATRLGIGPGTPYFEDASARFRAALAEFDFGTAPAEQRAAELNVVLTQTRKRDALTLWHLLARVNESERGTVYDRLAVLVPPPARVTRQGILRLDQTMLDLWWNQLDLGDVSLWRTWERSGSEGENGGK